MVKALTKKGEFKKVGTEKDTWILEVPSDVCEREGFAIGTLVSLTIKNNGIQAEFIRPPSKKLQAVSKQLLRKNRKLYDGLKRLGD